DLKNMTLPRVQLQTTQRRKLNRFPTRRANRLRSRRKPRKLTSGHVYGRRGRQNQSSPSPSVGSPVPQERPCTHEREPVPPWPHSRADGPPERPWKPLVAPCGSTRNQGSYRSPVTAITRARL